MRSDGDVDWQRTGSGAGSMSTRCSSVGDGNNLILNVLHEIICILNIAGCHLASGCK